MTKTCMAGKQTKTQSVVEYDGSTWTNQSDPLTAHFTFPGSYSLADTLPKNNSLYIYSYG